MEKTTQKTDERLVALIDTIADTAWRWARGEPCLDELIRAKEDAKATAQQLCGDAGLGVLVRLALARGDVEITCDGAEYHVSHTLIGVGGSKDGFGDSIDAALEKVLNKES